MLVSVQIFLFIISSWFMKMFCSTAVHDIPGTYLVPYQRALTKRRSLLPEGSSILDVLLSFQYVFSFISIKFVSPRTSKAFRPLSCVTKRYKGCWICIQQKYFLAEVVVRPCQKNGQYLWDVSIHYVIV